MNSLLGTKSMSIFVVEASMVARLTLFLIQPEIKRAIRKQAPVEELHDLRAGCTGRQSESDGRFVLIKELTHIRPF